MRAIHNAFKHLIETLPIIWWPVVVFSFIFMYTLLEDWLEKTLWLPMIYHRRLLGSLYAVVVITICFPQTVYDLLMLGVDLVLFAWKWLASFYLDLSKWLIQFWIQIGFGEMQPKEIPMYTVWRVRWNTTIFWGRVRIVVSIGPDTFVAIWRKLRRFLWRR